METEQLAIPPEWKPELNLLPHHFLRQNARRVLCRRITPMRAARLETEMILNSQDGHELGRRYTEDVLGTTPHDRQIYTHRLEYFFRRLYNLKNRSVVHLNHEPDGYCGSCAIGKHCRATNFLAYDPNTRKVSLVDGNNSEESVNRKILRTLKEYGFKEGQDFLPRVTNATELDYHGKALTALDLEDSTPVTTTFQSLLVKVSALRVLSYVDIYNSPPA